jgi:hypothetical protein
MERILWLICLVTEADSVELGHRSHSAFEVGQIHWACTTTEKIPLNFVYFRVIQLTNEKVNDEIYTKTKWFS